MGFLVDTNIVIHALDGEATVLANLENHDGSVVMSALSFAELQRGLIRDPPRLAVRRARLDVLIGTIPLLAFDEVAARAYGAVIAQVGWSRSRDFDRLIAAQALAGGHVMVTQNLADFRDIPGLLLESWARHSA